MRAPRASVVVLAAAAAVFVGALFAWQRLERGVRSALDDADPSRRPLTLTPLVPDATPAFLPRWGGPEVDGVVVTPAGLVAAGGSGVFGADGDLGAGLPALKAGCLGLWRDRLVVGLAQGGIFVRMGEGWQELRSGWGTLHARAFAESAGGELWIGARQGLFRAAWGDTTLERVDARSVRAVAIGASRVLAGGEKGLLAIEGRTARDLETPDAWIEAVAEIEGTLWAVTATGLARALRGDSLEPVRGGEEAATGVAHAGSFFAVTGSGDAVLRFGAAGGLAEEALPATARRLFAAGGELLADTTDGLLVRTPFGWRPALRARPDALPPGPAHVSALARLDDRVVAGLFDGGLLVGTPRGEGYAWHSVPGSAAWGVNALLPAGGVVWVASLRGAARFDGARLVPVDGPGAAFALAATADGIAVGYGQGVQLPDGRLLSAFHGLPGNQATALLAGPGLVVGTPSGLGAIEARRVAWRATSAEGRLPHPWVTALAEFEGSVFVGTYGGGVVRRARDGRFVPLPETEGLKVSAGALVADGDTLWLGSEGRGLFRLAGAGGRFEALHTALPSPRVTALLPLADGLLVGTDEGLVKLHARSR